MSITPDDGHDVPERDDGPDGPDDAGDESGATASGEPGAAGEGRRRRRRRRRRNGGEGAAPTAPAAEGDARRAGEAPAGEARSAAPADGRQRRDWNARADRREPAASASPPAPSPAANVDGGWDDAPEGDAAAGTDASPATGDDRAAGQPSAPGEGRRSRRRRRRGERGADGTAATEPRADGAEPSLRADVPADGASAERPRAEHGGDRGPRPDQRSGRERDNRGGRRDERGGRDRGREPNAPASANEGGARDDRRGRGERGRETNAPAGERGGRERGSRDERRGRDTASAEPASTERAAQRATEYAPPTPRLEQGRRPAPIDDDAEPVPESANVAWGTDEDGPPKAVSLAADLPAEVGTDDVDPASAVMLDSGSAPLATDVANLIGARFVVGGRIQWFDAGDDEYAIGTRVIVDSDRGPRLATIATAAMRKQQRERTARRVIRRANEQDLKAEHDSDADRAKALRIAKDVAAALRLPLKVFRVDLSGPLGRGGKVNVYYNSDERLDLRDFVRDLGHKTGGRIELRQLGTRDEAKAVGGIGSCGLTLCCTTWLPDFVPVSIKMAKDQGLVLSPTKIAGQCGRLKCCLVYEQAGYAEMRKGLPKLGKRVVSARGEGRVVEVDVLRQRVRVSYGMGDTEVLPAAEVKPLFPTGNQPGHAQARGDDDREDREDRATDAPAAAEQLYPDLDDDADDQGPTDDPSSDDFQP